jgi:hypothetical protein
MLRDTFAIRFHLADGPSKALRRLLGLSENTPIKRYLDAARSSRTQPEISLKQMRE